MESILARALEYTLKYWLKSFSRDQFKLQGRTVQLSNLDINGDALHASLGLPPAINVATAKIGKLEIKLPYVSNVQVEPIVVQIDKLDLVLEENTDPDSNTSSSSSAASSTGSGKGSGYGFADKIADGMTLEVGIVNLLLDTRGGVSRQEGAAWASPLASITMRNLLLYTTNEHWQVVNLKEARDYSNEEKFIYVFKKLEWESLSVDLLPHPDMLTEMDSTFAANGGKKRGDDGAKRVFFGGERFLEGIAGQAHITVQRDEMNSPLGLEVRLHVTEAVCPALSEPGLRALLRFMTGMYVCLNRGYVDPNAPQGSAKAAGRSIVSILVDHIFLCIKDSEFQLDLLMQSLFFSRASVSDGEHTKNLTHITIAGMFLRDTFSRPTCTLVQPAMQMSSGDSPTIPDFGKNFFPPIYPLGEERKLDDGVPLICLYTLQIKPSPPPPLLASQTVIFCQPLVINLQEESCLRITSFLADGIVVNPGVVLSDFSLNSLQFELKEFDLIVPLSLPAQNSFSSFSGARLHVKNFFISESPTIKFQLLNLEKDPACFCLWDGQPVDTSQRKWATQVSYLSLSLETASSLNETLNGSQGLWHCVELHEGCFEAAMATNDGSPLITTPPSGGIVRIGFSCEQYLSNTSIEQLFFILDLYAYFGKISEKIEKVRKGNKMKIMEGSPEKSLLENPPSDTAVSLAIGDLQLKFIESSGDDVQGMPLVHFGGEDLFVKVTHRTLGGAIAVSSSLCWKSVHVDCVTSDITSGNDKMGEMPNGFPHMKAIFWIDHRDDSTPFLDISTVHVMPYHAKDAECHSLTLSARLAGVRLGGGMNYTEVLLHRFGILGPDGGPGEGLSKGLKNLSAGPLSKILKSSPLVAMDGGEEFRNGDQRPHLELGKPDDVDITIELRDWSFALEGANEMEGCLDSNGKQVHREDRSWHTTFHSLQMKAKSTPNETRLRSHNSLHGKNYPVELVTVSVEGLQAFKPRNTSDMFQNDFKSNRMNEVIDSCGGVNLEARVLLSGEDKMQEMPEWIVENIKFSVKQPIEAVATKEEIQHLAVLCKSEAESMGRIAAGIIRVLDLDKSIGQTALDQLSSLGSEGVDKIFTPKKLSRRNSISSTEYNASFNLVAENPKESLQETITLLETAVSDSQSKCSALVSRLDRFDESVSEMNELKEKIDNIQQLLAKLRSQV